MSVQHKQLAQYFLNGDEDGALDYMEELVKVHSKAFLYQEIITPAMYYIGELWEQNKITVADEHLATAICDFSLSRLESELKPIKGKHQTNYKALLFGVEDEQHYIGLKMVADTFKEQGWRVRYLGPNLSMEHSMSQIEKFRPDVIGLSAALSYRLPVLKKVLYRFMELEWKPLVMIGGRMAKKFQLDEFESAQVMVVKDLNHLYQWFNEGREGAINETS
ncbi:Methanogenic corrinoid protein MtbC1 [Halobacillus alkaliphilus]|uniref:Methanogenic corrinoid protein MtbC1 n=1 Tax=Halobacillus alkaliphilus TaxID=396056 RepID=A0A1I2MN76_9BACI|nr:cobalamin B12-binding domain-containing protein [Halobacillus alkaliphilus]SFF90826.1 Methanogenic corrinoid protein MtbC1 [Halobacillus alkaliphilus]